jgi:hypothetical protein
MGKAKAHISPSPALIERAHNTRSADPPPAKHHEKGKESPQPRMNTKGHEAWGDCTAIRWCGPCVPIRGHSCFGNDKTRSTAPAMRSTARPATPAAISPRPTASSILSQGLALILIHKSACESCQSKAPRKRRGAHAPSRAVSGAKDDTRGRVCSPTRAISPQSQPGGLLPPSAFQKMCIKIRATPWASMPEALGLHPKSTILNPQSLPLLRPRHLFLFLFLFHPQSPISNLQSTILNLKPRKHAFHPSPA